MRSIKEQRRQVPENHNDDRSRYGERQGLPRFAIAFSPLGIHCRLSLCQPPGHRLVCRRTRQGRHLESQRRHQAMAVTTVTTAMQVVNAMATANIAAIFFMIASPVFAYMPVTAAR